jgi:hypothetical protein
VRGEKKIKKIGLDVLYIHRRKRRHIYFLPLIFFVFYIFKKCAIFNYLSGSTSQKNPKSSSIFPTLTTNRVLFSKEGRPEKKNLAFGEAAPAAGSRRCATSWLPPATSYSGAGLHPESFSAKSGALECSVHP